MADSFRVPGTAGPGRAWEAEGPLRGRVGLHLTVRGRSVSGLSPRRPGAAGPAQMLSLRHGEGRPGCLRAKRGLLPAGGSGRGMKAPDVLMLPSSPEAAREPHACPGFALICTPNGQAVLSDLFRVLCVHANVVNDEKLQTHSKIVAHARVAWFANARPCSLLSWLFCGLPVRSEHVQPLGSLRRQPVCAVTGHLSSRPSPLWRAARRGRPAVWVAPGSAGAGRKVHARGCATNHLLSNEEAAARNAQPGPARARPSRRLQTRVGASDTDVHGGREGLWL